jgi:hypothetical protein
VQHVVSIPFLARVMHALTSGVDPTLIDILVPVQGPKLRLMLSKPRLICSLKLVALITTVEV